MVQLQAEDARKAGATDVVDAVGPRPGEHGVVRGDEALGDELRGLLVHQRCELVDGGFEDDVVRTEGSSLLDGAATMLLLDCGPRIVDAREAGACAQRVPHRGRFLDSLPVSEGSASEVVVAAGGIGGRVVGIAVNTGHEGQ